MVSYLSQYHGGYRIFTVIKEKEKADEWLSAGLSVGILNNDSLTLMPDGIVIPFTRYDISILESPSEKAE